MSKPINIIKIEHTDRIGFDLINVLHSGKVSVLSATKSNDPCVVVAGMGDFRGEVIPVSGDVTIMNSDGVVLAEVRYEKLMSPARIEEQVEAVLQPVREALGGEMRLETKEEVEERRRRYAGGSIQGTEPQQFVNQTELPSTSQVHEFNSFPEVVLPYAMEAILVLENYPPHGPYRLHYYTKPKVTNLVGFITDNIGTPILVIFKDELLQLSRVEKWHGVISKLGLNPHGKHAMVAVDREGLITVDLKINTSN